MFSAHLIVAGHVNLFEMKDFLQCNAPISWNNQAAIFPQRATCGAGWALAFMLTILYTHSINSHVAFISNREVRQVLFNQPAVIDESKMAAAPLASNYDNCWPSEAFIYSASQRSTLTGASHQFVEFDPTIIRLRDRVLESIRRNITG